MVILFLYNLKKEKLRPSRLDFKEPQRLMMLAVPRVYSLRLTEQCLWRAHTGVGHIPRNPISEAKGPHLSPAHASYLLGMLSEMHSLRHLTFFSHPALILTSQLG